MIGVQSLSMLEGAFERTRAYTKDRMVFGKPLIKLQVRNSLRIENIRIKLLKSILFKTIQHRLAEVKTDAAVGRAFCDSAMRLFMEGMWFEL